MTTIPSDDIKKDIIDIERRSVIIDAELSSLIESRPDQWVAFVEGDEWFFADSLPLLLEQLDMKGKRRDTAIIASLTPRNDYLIL